MSTELLGLLGSLNIIMLSVIAYFFRGLVDGTNEIKLKLGILITKHDNTEKTADKNAAEIEKLKADILQLKLIVEKYINE